MVPYAGFPRKLFTTSFTFEGLFTSMNPEMVVKVAAMVELSSTCVTFEGTFTLERREN